MAKAATKAPAKSKVDALTEVQVRLEIVKTVIVIDSFVEMELPVQISIIDTLTQYVLTGNR